LILIPAGVSLSLDFEARPADIPFSAIGSQKSDAVLNISGKATE